MKSWVIGVEKGQHAKAYDWNGLVSDRFIHDSLPGTPLMIVLENDTATFHVLSRQHGGKVLQFRHEGNRLVDLQTNSVWNADGTCVNGAMKGETLNKVKSSQEFWHSWLTFHPATLRYKM
jgi:hypothetical protein